MFTVKRGGNIEHKGDLVTSRTTRLRRLMAVSFAFALVAGACGGDDDDAGGGGGNEPAASEDDSSDGDDSEEQAPATTAAPAITIAPNEVTATTAPADEPPPTTEPAVAASGTLRYVEFSPVTSFNPAASQSAQTAYLYPVYDTLTRQNSDFSLSPGLATGWTNPTPNVWSFTLRDDVVFHDGASFNAQVAADNFAYHAGFEGNPNASTWAAFVGATVVDDYTVDVEFAGPAPQFPLEMSMVMGMMISPNALDGSDLTRDPQGSGPWIWSDSDSEAGVTEVYNLNPDYWNPADQGVETISVTTVADNNARMNALITGEADIMSTTRDAQIDTGLDEGMILAAVPNYYPYLLIADREGSVNAPLADPNVRRAILLAMDLDAYNDAIHAGKGDAQSGYYPEAFGQFHVPELGGNPYDPDEAKRLLAEAGYEDGLTIDMPVMPAIAPHMDIVIQMLGAVGINVNVAQINNGELGPRMRAGESPVTWFRDLLVHPGKDLGKFLGTEAPYNPFGLSDADDLQALLQEALGDTDPESARAKYAEVVQGMIDLGLLIPLGHGGQNNMYPPNVTGVVLGLNMQAALPYGVRVDG